jgi:hypothetical protein
MREVLEPDAGAKCVTRQKKQLGHGCHAGVTLLVGSCSINLKKTACSFRWIIVTESTVRWFIMRKTLLDDC